MCANNDVVQYYLDGALVYTGSTWESYYHDVESTPRAVDSLLFRVGTAIHNPNNEGKGMFIDNINTDVIAIPQPCPTFVQTLTLTETSDDCNLPAPTARPGSMGMNMGGGSICSADAELSAALEAAWASSLPLFDDNSFASMRASVALSGDWENAAATSRDITFTITYVTIGCIAHAVRLTEHTSFWHRSRLLKMCILPGAAATARS
jgi:hypothetical protein